MVKDVVFWNIIKAGSDVKDGFVQQRGFSNKIPLGKTPQCVSENVSCPSENVGCGFPNEKHKVHKRTV